MNIGRNSYLSATTNITAPVNIGSFVAIARDVQMHNFPQHASVANHLVVPNFSMNKFGSFPPASIEEKPITIGNDVWIGTGAILLDGITVGDGAIIGAYAVVAKDIEPYAVVVGNPAKVVRYRFYEDFIEKLLKIKWWDWDDEVIKARLEDFKDIEVFIRKYGN